MPYEPDDAVNAWLREFAAGMLVPVRLDALIGQINASITEAVPEMSADRELRRDLEASSRDQGGLFLTWLGQARAEVVPPAAAHALARTVARRGLPLRTLMRIYHLGHRAVLDYQAEIMGRHDTDPGLEGEAMIRLAQRASHWLNATLEILTDTYLEERERGLQGRYARRAETVQAIMRGEVLDEAAASMGLGHPVSGLNTAVALWADDGPSAESISDLEDFARTLADAVGAARLLCVPSGSRGVWAWLSGGSGPVLERMELSAPEGLHATTGNPGRGLAGFRLSHREALAAQAATESWPVQRRLIRYADVEIAHLLSGRPDAARVMVVRELGRLSGADSASVQLRTTLHAYLKANRSPDLAARSLGVHKNTVRYRIQKIEEILGHPVADARRLKLELALEYTAATEGRR